MLSVDSTIKSNIPNLPLIKHTIKIIEKVTQKLYIPKEHIKLISSILFKNILTISIIKHTISPKTSPNLLPYTLKIYKLKENTHKNTVSKDNHKPILKN